jgi:hypothetical protein
MFSVKILGWVIGSILHEIAYPPELLIMLLFLEY